MKLFKKKEALMYHLRFSNKLNKIYYFHQTYIIFLLTKAILETIPILVINKTAKFTSAASFIHKHLFIHEINLMND